MNVSDILNSIKLSKIKCIYSYEHQFVYPGLPVGGSELILTAPSRVGVIREKKFAMIVFLLNDILNVNYKK